MDLELNGKRAIVTGGSRGIGKAIARQLAMEGCDVAIAARNPETLEAAANELTLASRRKVVGLTVDTQDDDSVRAMVAGAVRALGGVDILVNCAARAGGQAPAPTLETMTNEDFDSELHTKVMGYIRCAREVVPHMRDSGWGRIINISGLAARQSGTILGSVRNVSVAALTKNLADELGPHGINVTVVHPGLTRTEATPGVLERRSQATGQPIEEVEAEMARGNSVNRIIDSSEIGYIVAFLASPKSIAINGDAIAAGGGVGRAIHY